MRAGPRRTMGRARVRRRSRSWRRRRRRTSRSRGWHRPCRSSAASGHSPRARSANGSSRHSRNSLNHGARRQSCCATLIRVPRVDELAFHGVKHDRRSAPHADEARPAASCRHRARNALRRRTHGLLQVDRFGRRRLQYPPVVTGALRSGKHRRALHARGRHHAMHQIQRRHPSRVHRMRRHDSNLPARAHPRPGKRPPRAQALLASQPWRPHPSVHWREEPPAVVIRQPAPAFLTHPHRAKPPIVTKVPVVERPPMDSHSKRPPAETVEIPRARKPVPVGVQVGKSVRIIRRTHILHR